MKAPRWTFFALGAAAFGIACTGSTSTDLFGAPGSSPSCKGDDCSATEPPPGTETEDGGTDPRVDGAPPTDGGREDASFVQGASCDSDKDCEDTHLCNWKTKRCSTPAPLGWACSRDEECGTNLCNWKTSQCSNAGGNGAACSRDSECASNVCNWKTSQCATKGAIGTACSRDSECASNLCNWKTNQCATPGGKNAPCRRGSECVSGACLTGDVCK